MEKDRVKDLDEDTRLKLIGLKALAADHNRHLDDIARVVRDLVGVTEETDTSGWVNDFTYGTDVSVEKLWKVLHGEAAN